MPDAPSDGGDAARNELERRAADGNPEAQQGLTVLDAASALVEQTSQAVSQAMQTVATKTVRPSAAEVARRRPQQAEPKVETPRTELVTITASGARAPIPDAIEVFSRSFDNIAGNKTGKEYVASFEVGGLHKLGRDAEENLALMSSAVVATQEARREETAITAAFCVPPTPVYEFCSVSDPTAGAVSLPELEAPRGAVLVSPQPTAFSMTGDTGMGVAWTSGSKTCFSFDCDTPVEFSTSATYTCYSMPNEVLSFFPERTEAILRESRVVHAASVNRQLIDAIETASTPYGQVGSGGGATIRLFANIALTAQYLRQKYNAPPSVFLDVLLPAWLSAVLEADLVARDSVNDPGVGLAAWTTKLRRLNIAPQWVYQWQDYGNSPAPPPTVDVLLYFAGSVQRLRGRTLDFGPIHDTTTNAQNRGGYFFEDWNGIARCGGSEIAMIENIDVCPNGETAPRSSGIVCEGS